MLNPPDYATDDMLVSAQAVAQAYRTALRTAGVRAVALSSIGAQHPEGTGNILTAHILEQALRPLGASFVRPGNFMSNWLFSPEPMRTGVLPSFLAPLDRPIPHADAADIARVVVRELRRQDSRIVELAAAADYAPHEVAAAFAAALDTPITAEVIERDQWEPALMAAGFPPAALGNWVRLWEGFNSGHIRFEATPERGQATIEEFARSHLGHSAERA